MEKKKHPGAAGTATGAKGTSNDGALNTGAAASGKGRAPCAVMLEAALAYAARGWKVFPAPPGTKKSYKSAKRSGGERWGATKDPDKVKHDFTRNDFPNANIGIPTDTENGFWVLDADTPKGHGVDGIAELRKLEDEHGTLPETLRAESPSGSLHYYFQHPEGVTVKNSEGNKGGVAPGVDVRGDGGMVLAPPSARKGGAYKWLNADTPIATAPDWLLKRATDNDLPDYLKGYKRPTGADIVSDRGNTLYDRINAAAFADIDTWVLKKYPKAKKTSRGGRRITGKMLGRNLEEDLSIDPTGIKDWGVADQGDSRKGGRTPIQTVHEYFDVGDYEQSARWLAKCLSISFDAGLSLNDFRAHMEGRNYIYTPTRAIWPAASVNARLGKIGKIPASLWIDNHNPADQLIWAPGEEEVINDRHLLENGGWIEKLGATCFNLYMPPRIVLGDPDKAERWVAHVHKIFNEDDAAHIIKWLAQRVQFPQIKINHALVLGSLDHGIGKDTTLVPVKHAVGPWNCVEVSAQQLMGRFNGYLKSVILRVNEARDLGGEISRYQFYEHLKEYSASPPETLRVDEKNLREHSVLNCLGIIITTNHKTDGIYLPAQDRRHYVAWSDRTKKDFAEGYWIALYHWYYEEGGNGHVAAYLKQLDISNFDPKSPPPQTKAFLEIVSANRTPVHNELADLIEDTGNPTVITIGWLKEKASENDFSSDLATWLNDTKNYRSIPHRLETCGYEQVPNADRNDQRWTINGSKTVVYARRDTKDQQKAVSEFITTEEDRLKHLRKK